MPRNAYSALNQAANAWLLQYQASKYIALPIKACQEIIEYPQILKVPGVAHHGHGLMYWRQQWLPLIDLASLLTNGEKASMTRYCLIVAYFDDRKDLQYVAVALPYMPHTISVTDDSLCRLPEEKLWESIALSCTNYNNNRVPIVDSSRLFLHNYQ